MLFFRFFLFLFLVDERISNVFSSKYINNVKTNECWRTDKFRLNIFLQYNPMLPTYTHFVIWCFSILGKEISFLLFWMINSRGQCLTNGYSYNISYQNQFQRHIFLDFYINWFTFMCRLHIFGSDHHCTIDTRHCILKMISRLTVSILSILKCSGQKQEQRITSIHSGISRVLDSLINYGRIIREVKNFLIRDNVRDVYYYAHWCTWIILVKASYTL